MTQHAPHLEGAGPETLKPAILRIYAERPGANGEKTSAGVGFLVDDQFALTCAHVVYQALGLTAGAPKPEGAVITVDLPLLTTAFGNGAVLTASVEELMPRQPTGSGDVAVLRLSAPVPGARPVRLVEAHGVWNHRAGAFGLPGARPDGVWHSGLLKAPQAAGWIQMNLDPASGGYAVSQGFSGGPVWDETLGCVVGMMAIAETGAPAVSYLIPTERLAAAWPRLRDLILPPSPFRSLKPFEESDQVIFHGRQEDSERIAAAVGRRGWTTLIGPTGSGKSSLVRAGVVPLRRTAGEIPVVVRPSHGSSPLRALAAELVPLVAGTDRQGPLSAADDLADRLAREGLHNIVPLIVGQNSASRLLVVIDQFEELLDHHQGDILALVALFSGDRRPAAVRVLATLRADFVEPVLSHQVLGPLVSQTFEGLMPMSRDQLRQAITQPVETVPGVYFEPQLDGQILKDTGTDPGVLPLLGFTLDLLWGHQENGMLTFQAYHALGGVAGALATYADRAWADVPDADRAAAQRLLPRLVRVPIGSEAPTRRVVPRTELSDDEWRVAQLLAAARLLVIRTRTDTDRENASCLDAESVELAHEVLLIAWPMLAQQVAADNAFLTWHESLRHDVSRWEKAQRPADLLPTRIALSSARPWYPDRADELSPAERQYLDRGHTHVRTRARARRAVIAFVCALALAVGATALIANQNRLQAARSAAITRSNTLAVDAAALTPTDPGLAAQLAVAAYRTSPTQAAADQLYASLDTPLDRLIATTGSGVLRIAAQSDGPLAAAVEDDGSLRLWNTADPSHPVLDASVRSSAAALALAPRLDLMAAACTGGKRLCLWKLTNPHQPEITAQLPLPPSLTGARIQYTSMAFSSDGSLLAAATEQGYTLVWSVADPAHPRGAVEIPNPTSEQGVIAGVAFSPHGPLLAQTIQGGTTQLWKFSPTEAVRTATISTGYQSVAFSPNGDMLAAADVNPGLWNISDPAHPASISVTTAVAPADLQSVAFSPDGSTLAYGGQDTNDPKGALCLVDLSPANLALNAVSTCTDTGFDTFALAYTTSGAILTGGLDGVVRLWRQPLPEVPDLSITGSSTWALSPDNRLLAAPLRASSFSGTDSQVGVWDISAPDGPVLDATLSLSAGVQDVSFLSTSGLLTVAHDGTVQLWNLHDPHHPVKAASLGTVDFPVVPKALDGADYILGPGVTAVGNLVAIQGSGRLRLWSVTSTLTATKLGAIPIPDPSSDIAGLADTNTVSVITANGITWWDISDPGHPTQAGSSDVERAAEGSLASGTGILAATTGVSTSGDKLVVFALPRGHLTHTSRLPQAVGSTLNMSSDGTRLAISGPANETLTLWDVHDPSHPHSVGAVGALQDTAGVTFSQDDQLMADWNRASIQIWGTLGSAAPSLLSSITIPANQAGGAEVSASFLSGHPTIAVATSGSVMFFDTAPTNLADRLCTYTGDTMTTGQWAQYAPGIPYRNPCPQ
ncbi:nSTAND1 domain-containing NTPase [Streptacidiphilus albus]|uniref:nSTAND1 domain-containing NTPase n=1 Tax=Streptacidiphilus albus TaxID=105425 RepID=UPI00068B475B|nr:trypsin-like peptidase domain-containing protein [Streptacidiphilus albus]